MPDAPRKYLMITPDQVRSARRFWPQVSDKTWCLVLKRGEEPMVLNKAPHRGVGFVTIEVPTAEQTKEGMFYRREMDVLILVAGETDLVRA
ncbi:MAG: hypothetical protein JNL73_03130 [Anaerolineales bacterium]|nr:hypothetical protein [Anaerolineales bacterium]